MAWQQQSLFSSLQGLFNSRAHPHNAATAATGGATIASEIASDLTEVAVTPEELPAELKEALSRTLALVAGTTNARDTRRILQENYARFAVFETNMMWCPHSISLATWMGAGRLLLMPYVEGIRCHRIVLCRVAAAGPPATASAAQQHHQAAPHGLAVSGGPPAGVTGEINMKMQMDVAFSWRPLAPLHGLMTSWGVKGLQLPLFTTEHTITLTVNPQSRVVEHRDITHNFPSAPPLVKTLLGLPTPLMATVLHVLP